MTTAADVLEAMTAERGVHAAALVASVVDDGDYAALLGHDGQVVASRDRRGSWTVVYVHAEVAESEPFPPAASAEEIGLSVIWALAGCLKHPSRPVSRSGDGGVRA
jgi:hypothetical protein